jgi:hypothetical protein
MKDSGGGQQGEAMLSVIPHDPSIKKSRDYMYKDREALEQAPILGGAVKMLDFAKDQDGIFGTIARFSFPFVTTPGNLARIGIGQYTPLGTAAIGMKLRRGKKGKSEWVYQYDSETGNLTPEAKYQLHHDMAAQFIAWTTTLALASLIMGDEDGEPFITGANATWQQQGEKAHEMRNYPPMSIRVGANQWLSYKRLDPFATGLASLVDAGWALRRHRNGMDGWDNLKKFNKSIAGQLKEKTYLRPIGDIMKAIESPDAFGQSLAVNYGSSFMPAVIRTAAVSMDDQVRDFRKTADSTLAGRTLSRALPVGPLQPIPKYDFMGRPITKPMYGGGVTELGRGIIRWLNPAAQVDTGTATNLDRLITNWNDNNPNDTYYVSVPRTDFVYKEEKYRMGDDGYDEFQRSAGGYIRKWWERQEQLGRTDYANPSRRDIDRLRRIVYNARKRARLAIIRKGLAKKL